MVTNSRTIRTIQNARTSLIIFIVQIILGFYSRKVFLNFLGSEVLGLNTTLGNILSFLNLAELGIGIAIATSLYKPIYDNNQKVICEIINVQKILYRRIAFIICLLGIILMLFFPFIFHELECNILYVYVAFGVFTFSTISSYLWNYKQVLIQADQKNFKLSPWVYGIRYFKILFQIFCLQIINYGIWGWIFWEMLGTIATIYIINKVLYKEYPWLHDSSLPSYVLLSKYHYLIIKTKQLFIHKISSFVLEQTSPLIIYGLVSLKMVTYYSNYIIIVNYIAVLMNVIFEGMGASIGNLISEGNKKHTLEVFWELFTSRIWISSIVCFGLFLFIEPFITLWIGSQYILSKSTLFLIIIALFIRLTRSVIDSFKNGFQLFGDIWAPIAESILNLGCSILLGYIYGINGVILGSNISLIIIVLIWKPYYTFKNGFNLTSKLFYLKYILHISIILLCSYISIYVTEEINFLNSNYLTITITALLSLFIYIIISFSILYLLTDSMKRFVKRVKKIKLINYEN